MRNGIKSPVWYSRLMALYHLTSSVGSAARGQSAAAKSDYILREGRYGDAMDLEVEYREHGNMPKWAESDPSVYWEAADENERKTGGCSVRWRVRCRSSWGLGTGRSWRDDLRGGSLTGSSCPIPWPSIAGGTPIRTFT